MAPWVLHVDMDQFIAAVEVLRRPELAGLPVIVGGRGDPTERGVVSTASYEARAFGVRSGMPLRTAVRRCPDAVVLPVDKPAYDAASAVVMDTLRAVPGAVVEVLGWDEAFVGVEADDPEAVARRHPGRRARRDRRCTARWGSATPRCGPRSRPSSASRGAPSGSPATPGSRSWGSGRRGTSGASGRRISQRLADAGGADGSRAGRGARTPCWQPSSGRRPGRGSGRSAVARAAPTVDDTPWVPRAHGRETTYQRDLADRSEVEDALRVLAAQVVDDIRAEGRPCARVHLKVRLRAVLHREPLAQARRADVGRRRRSPTRRSRSSRALGDERPVRLLGVRAEMVPPEGGYDPPRTHGRRGMP